MTGTSLIIVLMNNGKYKLKLWGQADGHLMDWRGCNYRIKDITPRKSFTTSDEAIRYANKVFPKGEDKVRDLGREAGNGTFFGDYPKGIRNWNTLHYKNGRWTQHGIIV